MEQFLSFFNLSSEAIVYLTVFSAFTFLSSIIVLPWLVLAIPSDYFVEEKRQPMNWKKGGRELRLIVLILKNLTGICLVLFGLPLLVLPGQGILTILAGLVLMDFPGKFHLLRSLATRRRVLKSLNWIRRKGNKEPFATEKQDQID